MDWPYNSISGSGSSTVIHHAVGGSERLTEGDVRDYLTASGYEAEIPALVRDALKFPGNWAYTTDRHRTIVHVMPGDWWRAADCTESEERIKAMPRGRRAFLGTPGSTS